MDPHEVFAKDPQKFAIDLEQLMDTAAAAASSNSSSSAASPITNVTSPPPTAASDPRLRKRPAPIQRPASKRIKVDEQLDQVAPSFVHPSRLDLVRPRDNASNLQSPTSPTEDLPSESDLASRKSSPMPVQPTGSNIHPLGASIADPAGETWNTVRNAVRRQWDTRKDDLAYENLLQTRRAERLVNVDRYVPGQSLSSPLKPNPIHRSSRTSKKPFPFDKLPGKVQDKILTLLLVRDGPLLIDFTWLRPFVNGHCRVPSASKTIKADGLSYSVPLDWTQLIEDVGLMQKDCSAFTDALEVRGNKTRKLKSPCRGLTTAVLRVSKKVHQRAAPIFYARNSFQFPWATSAWMQLESFLATIGPANVASIRSIGIHVPLWHRGIMEDFIEGAILDLTSPASRLGIVKPAGRDRLLSAVRSSVKALLKAGNLQDLSLELEHGMVTDRWAGRYSNDRQLISTNEAEEHVIRKQQGIELLSKLTEALPSKPQLTLHHPSSASKIAKYDLSEFRSRLSSVIREADKYGWKVDQHLKGRRW